MRPVDPTMMPTGVGRPGEAELLQRSTRIEQSRDTLKRIITHSKPDADAIAAAWLAVTYLFGGEEVEVVFHPRPRSGQAIPTVDCVVDIGGIHDPERLVFDHKGPTFADRNATCATRLVWEHLMSLGRPVAHLEVLVRVIHEGDHSPPGRPSPELARSRSVGFHSHLKRARTGGGDDLRFYGEMKGWLERHDREERAKFQLARELGPNESGGTRANAKSLDTCDEIVVSQPMTSASAGEAELTRTARVNQFSDDILSPTPSPVKGDVGIPDLESLLSEYRRLCQWDEASSPVSTADSAERVAAMRGAVAKRPARLKSGSRTAKCLRGLCVLLEVERVAPGHLRNRRRAADGWSSPLSLARGTPGREALERVASEFSVEAGALAEDLRLAEAIELIARNCGTDALGHMVAQGGRFGESIILSIARKGPERQRYALAEAALGRDPLARPAAGVWPMDTRNFAKVPGRLGRALGAVDGSIAVLPALLRNQRPSGDEVAGLRWLSTRIIECSEKFLQIVIGRGASEVPDIGAHLSAGERNSEGVVGEGLTVRTTTLAQVRGRLDAAQYFVEKTARDVSRMPADLRPAPERASHIRGQLLALIDKGGRLIEVIGAERQER